MPGSAAKAAGPEACVGVWSCGATWCNRWVPGTRRQSASIPRAIYNIQYIIYISYISSFIVYYSMFFLSKFQDPENNLIGSLKGTLISRLGLSVRG